MKRFAVIIETNYEAIDKKGENHYSFDSLEEAQKFCNDSQKTYEKFDSFKVATKIYEEI